MEKYNEPGATKNYDEFIVTAAEIEQMKAGREWISVKDYLPDEDIPLIYATVCGCVTFGERSKGDWYYYDPHSYDPIKREYDTVTHWMYKPVPPEGE